MLYRCTKEYWENETLVASVGDLVEINDCSGVFNTRTHMKVIECPDKKFIEDHFTSVSSGLDTYRTVDDDSKSCDLVNHPPHYTQHPSGIECITITRHYCFSIGNAIKYLWRAGLKTDAAMSDKAKEIQDLEKAIWYINDRIEQLKNGI